MKNFFITTTLSIFCFSPVVGYSQNYKLPSSCESKVVYSALQNLLRENGFLVNGCATIKTQRPVIDFNRSLVVLDKKPYCQEDKINTSERVDAITYFSYVNDVKSSITSYAVRAQRIPKDGYSIECSLLAELKQTSKSESFENRYLFKNIFIRLLKNGSADGMYFEYDINQSRLLSSKIAGTGVTEIRKGLKSDTDMGLMSSAELSAVGRTRPSDNNR